LAPALPASAAQLDQRNELINTYVTQMHADPLVADCAAHGNFIASMSGALDHVEFSPQSFDRSHATITPWGDSFDEGKQRVKVDTVVQVSGVGVPQNGNGPTLVLKFRCGYVGNQMLAFSWNDPVPPDRARTEGPPSARGGAPVRGQQTTAASGKGKSHAKTAAGKKAKKADAKQRSAKKADAKKTGAAKGNASKAKSGKRAATASTGKSQSTAIKPAAKKSQKAPAKKTPVAPAKKKSAK